MSTLRTEFQKELSRRSKEVLIKEAIIAIVAEQAIEQQQLQQAAPVAPANPANPPVSPDAPPPGEPAPAEGTAEVTVDTVIDKLNVIRGGSSFSDPEVYGQLTTFWNSIPQDQRAALDGQLNSIGKIVSIAEPQEAQAATPGGGTPPNAPPAQAPGGVPAASGQAPIAPSQPSF